MIGMLEGLRAGTADARQAEELDMRRQQYAAEMAMRQRALAMQEAQHAQAMQEGGLRLNRMRDQDAARQNFEGLARREADNRAFLSSGMAGPVNPVSDRDFNAAGMRMATANGDIKGAIGLRTENRRLDANDAAERMAADPEFQKTALNYISTKDMFPLKVEEGARDAKTGKQKSPDRLVFDSGYQYQLKDGDRLKIARGVALMKNGFQDEGLAVLDSVNKELAAAVDTANKRTLTAYDFTEKSRHNVANEELRGEQFAATRASRAAAGAQVRMASWQMERLLKGEKLGQEAGGYAQGLALSKGMGAEGKDAAGIYQAQLDNVYAQMRGLGLQVPKGPRDIDPKMQADIYKQYRDGGMSHEEALAMSQGVSIPQMIAERLQAAAAAKAKAQGPQAGGAPTSGGRGLFTDREGNTQLMEPFTRFNDWRRGLQEQTNANGGY